MNNNPENKIDDLPADWWQRFTTSQVLSEWFNKHLVCLLVRWSENNRSFQKLFSGFPVRYGNSLLWFSAGHIVKELEDQIKKGTLEVSRMKWVDGYEIKEADSVPLYNENPKMFWKLDDYSDIGVIRIEGLEAGLILNNENLVVMEEGVWRNIENANPEGYYLVGYPEQWTSKKFYRESSSQTRISIQAGIACLPVKRVEHSDLPRHIKIAWKDTKSFYGKILDFPEGSEFQPQDIAGMSGGPLLSIERRDGKFNYRLYGIQSKWFPDSRIIRVQLLQEYLEILNIT